MPSNMLSTTPMTQKKNKILLFYFIYSHLWTQQTKFHRLVCIKSAALYASSLSQYSPTTVGIAYLQKPSRQSKITQDAELHGLKRQIEVMCFLNSFVRGWGVLVLSHFEIHNLPTNSSVHPQIFVSLRIAIIL